MTSHAVPGFLPSTSGFRFANAFQDEPVFEIPLGRSRIPIGNASDGLCGGMVFAARDLFEAGSPPPHADTPPRRGSAPFDFLARRLIESWNPPQGPLKYLAWMSLPDADSWFGRGVWWRTARQEWPLVRAEIDSGQPSALGLVRVRSLNPWDLAFNHQVLAYGYDLDEARGELSVAVYDPNHPLDDGLRLRLQLHRPGSRLWYIPGERPVRGFFRTPYRPRDPGPLLG